MVCPPVCPPLLSEAVRKCRNMAENAKGLYMEKPARKCVFSGRFHWLRGRDLKPADRVSLTC